MAALIGTVLAFVAFGVVLKLADVYGLAPTPVAAVNYAFASLVCGYQLTRSPESLGGPAVWALGVVAGVAFVAGFYVNYWAIRRVGLSLAQPVVSISVVVPIIAAIVFWHEVPAPAQVLAIALACLALVLLGSANGKSGEAGAGTRGAGVAPLLALLFGLQGVVSIAPKAVEEFGFGGYRWGYLTVLFTTAAVGAGVRWLQTRDRPAPMSLVLGIGFGTANIAGTTLLLAALAALPAVIVYPVTSVGSMVVASLLGIVVWSERPGRRALVGIALAIPAAVLLST